MTTVSTVDSLDFITNTYSTWNPTFIWTNSVGAAQDLTGYTVALQWRAYPANTAVLSLTQASGITVTAATGTMAVVATGTQTGAITPGIYSYDLVVTSSGGVVTTILEGRINLVAGISHA